MSRKHHHHGNGCGEQSGAAHTCGIVRVRPLDDRIVIEPEEAEDESAGGIILPDVAKGRPQRGKVLAVGPGKLLTDGQRGVMEVQVGDTVIFQKYSGQDVEVGDHEVKVLRADDILAVVEE